jgi:very-short-patch-repair endonuclease
VVDRPTINKFRRQTARRLRATSTDVEKILWRHLRRMEIEGSHFRQQVPIGPYVVDFACMAAHLVVEVDGSQHAEAANETRDLERTARLERQGYRVVRFWNSAVLKERTAVLDVIYTALYGSRDTEPKPLKHARVSTTRIANSDHPTPARSARRPSPSRGG